MLSAQTKDEVTHAALSNMQNALGAVSVENVIAADVETIERAVCKVGFWRRKSL